VGSETDQIDLGSQFAGPSAYALFQNYIQTSSQAGLRLAITSTDKTQFGPRFGFAWRPFGDKTVLRGGYGSFFEQENTDGRVNNNMVPFRLDETGINDLTQRRTMADFFNGKALTASAAPTLGPTATDMKLGRNHHFNLGVQQQVTPGTVLEVNYVGNIGQDLNGTTNINIPAPAAGGVQARRPFAQFGNACPAPVSARGSRFQHSSSVSGAGSPAPSTGAAAVTMVANRLSPESAKIASSVA
jgi:hypothetical protein